jgi:hypothetical protein
VILMRGKLLEYMRFQVAINKISGLNGVKSLLGWAKIAVIAWP